MPATAALIDELREAFGAESINPVLRAAMNGEPDKCFFTEKAQTFGTPFLPAAAAPLRVGPLLCGNIDADIERAHKA
jgi:hypothetical protein